MKWNPTSGTDQTRQPGWIDREVNKKEKLLSGLEAGEWELLPRWIKVENKAKFYSINKIQNFGIRHDAESLNERDGYGSEDVHWIQSKWCSTCESYRPPRSSHCRICDCCIEGIDHHCNYLNNCIGARNYRTFFAFLVSCVIDLIIIIGCSIWKIVTFDGPSQGSVAAEAIKRNALSVFVVLISILMLIPVSALTGYHVFLTLSDLTTVEYIKSQTAKKVLKENKFLVEQNYGKDAFKTNSKSKSKNLSKVKGARGQNDYNYDQEGFRNEEEGEDSHTEGVIKTSLKLVLARLCRPGTETWVEWNSYSNFEEDNLDGSSQNYHQSFGAVNQDSHDLNNFDIKLNNNGTRNKETD
ncbi:DHHC palmitoyltransferase-domain-containing protein [Phakopsora pachyrhizi]|uniref:Palmitoyltransferase n=1 Tax=Phakopsora pachyrhizi TaxID=170000 RepID=A0AAV0BWH9_PHAPC|nr:DHHC palmitoyltransferase-domain-containing protein [Phakopsora pachyrhizi]